MRPFRLGLYSLLVSALFVGAPASAKQGVEATVLTDIPASSAPGTEIKVQWRLASKEGAHSFSACGIFIRLKGPDGDTTESFAPRCTSDKGVYEAVAIVPASGVASVEIGVAGTMTQNGVSSRSDWLMELVNDPIR